MRREYGKAGFGELAAVAGLLLLTSVLYLWNLTINGMANSYYAAAAQAASTNWTAWLFGSLDAANFVSVDKPPISMMIMGLSDRLFGFSSWSMLMPHALAGVATVMLVYAAVKRWYGAKAGLIAGVVMALTPAAALMFRFNNPDSFLTLFLTASAYTFLRAFENKKPVLWLCLAGLFTSLAFNTKMLQGLLVLPGDGTALSSVRPAKARDTPLASWRGNGCLDLLVERACVAYSSGSSPVGGQYQ